MKLGQGNARLGEPRVGGAALFTYFEFEISLKDLEPLIWRRFLVHATATFADLHESIQVACGWENKHPFEFRTSAGEPIAGLPEAGGRRPPPDAREVRLDGVFGAGKAKTCIYLYDFGDPWEHEVVWRRRVTTPEQFTRRLLGGARAFPPEDCGSYEGYEACVRAVRSGEDPGEIGEWLGDWDPERFNLRAVSRRFDR